MNNPIVKALILFVFLMAGFLYGTKIFGSRIKPSSEVEFKISKHAGLHTVHGGFKVKYHNYKKFEAGVYTRVNATVGINTLWTYQADADASDDPKRTKDLLSDDWFDAKKFPLANAHIHWLPLNDADNVVIELTIKGITKKIKAKVRDSKLLFRIVLKDFKINASWKSIFAGNYADVSVQLVTPKG